MARTRKNGGIIGKRRETKVFSKSGVWSAEDVAINVPYSTKEEVDTARSPTGWVNTTDVDPYYNQVVYHMDDAQYTDSVARDKSVNYWDESLSPDQYWKIQLPVYSGPRYRDWSTFFGEGGYYQVANKTDMVFGTSNFTIEFWYKAARKDATEYYIMGKGGNAGRTSGTGWVVYVSTAYNIGFYDAVGNTSYQSSGTLSTDTWYHIAIVRSGTGANGLSLYVDGALQAQGTCASNFADTSVTYIGRDRVATSTTWSSGWLTDIRFCNTAKYGSPFTRPSAALDMSGSDVVFSHSMLKPHHDNIPQKHAQYAVITFPGSTLQRMIDTPFINNATRLTGHGSHAVHCYDGGRSLKIYDNKSFTITGTTANVLTVSTTMGLTTGQPILLSGTTFGSLTATQFYVGNVLSTTTMTISSTAGGADFATGASASGTMTATNNSLRFGTGAFTIEMWVYITNNTLTNGFVGKGTGNYGAGGTGWSLLIDSSGWLQWADAASTLIGNATGNSGYWTGWYHVAVVRESTATNKFKMYMNGALQYMGTVTTDYNITDDFRLWGTRNDQYTLRGSVCGLRVSRVARYNADFVVPTAPLTATQSASSTGNIAAITSTTSTSLLLNTVASGSYITDSSNTPVTITATGSPTWNSLTPFSGNVAGSIQFNGTSQYLTAPTSAVFAMGTGAFNVEAWVYITSLATVSTIIDFRSAAGNSAFYLSVLTTGALRFFDGPATGAARDTPTGVITANTWYHVAATRVNSVLRLYVNGILQYYLAGATSDFGATTQPVTIGRSADSAAYNYFVGYLTGLRVVKGLSVYTSSFDVESTAFIDASMTTDYNTSLMLATTGNNTPVTNNLQHIDYGSERNVIWRYGNETMFGHSHPYSRHGYSFFNYASNNNHLHVTDAGSNFNFGSGDFSLEFWNCQFWGYDTFSTIRWLYDSRVYFNDTGLGIRLNSYQKIDVVTNNVPILKDTAVYQRNRHWSHIVVQRVNGNIALYIDGRRRAETRYTGTINAPGNKLFFGNGAYPNIQYNSPNYGLISDIRMLKGTAAYSSGQIFTTARSVSSNVITVDSTANFAVNQPIVFRGTAFGSIVAGTTYYILTVPSSTTLTISATQGGATFAAGTATGTMYAKVGVGMNPEFIRVPTEPTTAIPDTVLLTCGAGPILRDYSGLNNVVQAGGRNEANFTSGWDVYITNASPYSGKDFDRTKYMMGCNYNSSDGYNFRSLGFQGDSTYPELSYITRMTKPWTIEFWIYGHNVNPASASNQQYWRTGTSAGHEGWDFYAHYNGTANSWGDLMFRKWRAADSTSEYISTTGGVGGSNYSPHGWNHIAIQYDPSATNKVALFCNGGRVATRAAFTAGTKSWNTYVLGNGQTGVGPVRISDIARYSNDTTTYTLPTQMWPMDANCVVLSNGDGPFYPKSNTATVMHYGTSASYQYKKFGNASMYFSNKETTLSERVYMGCNYWNVQALSPRRGDFTIETWACWKDAASGGTAPNATAGNVLWHYLNHIRVGITAAGYWKFEQASGGGTAPTYYQQYADTSGTLAATAASGRFDHVVVVRKAGDYHFYVNGVEKYIMLMSYWGSYTAGQGPTSNWDADLYDSYLHIGCDYNGDTNTDWSGYMQDFRFTMFARYETRVINNIPTMVHAQTEVPALPTRLFPTK